MVAMENQLHVKGTEVTQHTKSGDPTDLITLAEAARRFGFDATTLQYRANKSHTLKIYMRQLGNRMRSFVSVAEMEQQPPVDTKRFSARGYKRPDVTARNKATTGKRKYTKRMKKEKKTNDRPTKTKAVRVVPVQSQEEQALERQIAYAFGRVQAWLDIYAGSIGVTPATLTHRVGQLLQLAESGSLLGSVNSLSSVR